MTRKLIGGCVTFPIIRFTCMYLLSILLLMLNFFLAGTTMKSKEFTSCEIPQLSVRNVICELLSTLCSPMLNIASVAELSPPVPIRIVGFSSLFASFAALLMCFIYMCYITYTQYIADDWQPFIERQDMLIWRRKEPDSGGLFAYKVYGSFSDVTADDFLQVQIDVDYRKQWDPTAQELQIIETDPKSESSVDHSTDIIHWEMIWPVCVSTKRIFCFFFI